MPKSSHQARKRTTAQAMVEFALALPVLLLVVYGLLETGRLLFMYASVVTAARQAARYGSATGDNGSGTKYYDDCGGITASARQLEFIQRFSNISIRFDHPGNTWHWEACPIDHADPSNVGHPANGDRIRVSVSSVFTPIVPLVPLKPFTITSTSNRTLLVGSYIEVSHPGEGFMGSGTQGFVLTKWADTDYYKNIGDKITYHYTIQNTGTTPINGPFYVNDNRIPNPSNPKGWPCTGAPNPLPGPSAVITCPNLPYTVTAADITTPEISNHARANNEDMSVFSNEAVYTVSFVPAPHIVLDKQGLLEGSVVDAGKNVNYTFTVVNEGNVPLTPPYTISDPLIGNNWSCPTTPNPLAVGASVVCTGQYTLRNSDIDASYLHNTATASAKYGTTTVTSPADTFDLPVPVLSLTGWSVNVGGSQTNPYTTLNQKLTLTFNYANRGTKTLSNLTLTVNSTHATVSCSPGSVAAGVSTQTCTMDYLVTQSDLDNGAIVDLVTLQGTQTSPSRTWTSNTLTYTLYGNQVGAVTITMSPSSTQPSGTSYAVNDAITYNFTFQNSGNITLKPPYAITLDNSQFGPGGTVLCTGPNPLKVGDPPFACPVQTYHVTQEDLDAGLITFHATGTAAPYIGSAQITQGTATATVITYKLPRLSLVKTPNQTSFTGAGEMITYTYGLKNTGGLYDVTVTPFALLDDKLGPVNCPAGTIAVGTTLSCGALNYTTTDADVAALLITNKLSVDPSNTGTATGGSPPGPVALVNNPATVTVPLRRCDSTTLYSTAITDGSTTTWSITNKTGTDLNITGGWMRWNNPVILGSADGTTGGVKVSYPGVPDTNLTITGASILLLPSSGWPVLRYSTANQTTMTFTFSGTAASIKVYITFEQTFNGLTCTLQSP